MIKKNNKTSEDIINLMPINDKIHQSHVDPNMLTKQ